MNLGINNNRHCFGQKRSIVRDRMQLIADMGFCGIRENNPGQGQYPLLEDWFAWWLPASDHILLEESAKANLVYRWQLTNANEGVEVACSPKLWNALDVLGFGSRMEKRRALIAGAILTPTLAESKAILNWLTEWQQGERMRLSDYSHVVFESMNVDIPKYSKAQEAATIIKNLAGSSVATKSSSEFSKVARKIDTGTLPMFVYEDVAAGFNSTVTYKNSYVSEVGWDLRKCDPKRPAERITNLLSTIFNLNNKGVKEAYLHQGVDPGWGEDSALDRFWHRESMSPDPYQLFGSPDSIHIPLLIEAAR